MPLHCCSEGRWDLVVVSSYRGYGASRLRMSIGAVCSMHHANLVSFRVMALRTLLYDQVGLLSVHYRAPLVPWPTHQRQREKSGQYDAMRCYQRDASS